MTKEEKAIDKLADMVISWQKMYNNLSNKIDKLDGHTRLRVKIEDKQKIIDSALGKYEED